MKKVIKSYEWVFRKPKQRKKEDFNTTVSLFSLTTTGVA